MQQKRAKRRKRKKKNWSKNKIKVEEEEMAKKKATTERQSSLSSPKSRNRFAARSQNGSGHLNSLLLWLALIMSFVALVVIVVAAAEHSPSRASGLEDKSHRSKSVSLSSRGNYLTINNSTGDGSSNNILANQLILANGQQQQQSSFADHRRLNRGKEEEEEKVKTSDQKKDDVEQKLSVEEAGSGRQMRVARRLKSTNLPEFAAPIGNVTAVLGRDVRLVCTVDHLGQYQVAWLKMETKTIISIDTNIIITNYRIFLIPDEEERKWVLHIKDVQESDRGFYQCQVNTNPMRSTSGYLEVVVPPTIIEQQTSQLAEVTEHSNVSIQCKANGHPRPSVSWRRDDGLPIKLIGRSANSNGRADRWPEEDRASSSNSVITQQQPSTWLQKAAIGSQQQGLISHQLNDIKSDRLSFQNVDRSMSGLYICTAANGIPTQAVKKIPLFVRFPPKTSAPNEYVYANLGEQLELECLIEAYPKANNYWSRGSLPLAQAAAHRLVEPAAPRWRPRVHEAHGGGAISSRPLEELGSRDGAGQLTEIDSTSALDAPEEPEGQSQSGSSVGQPKPLLMAQKRPFTFNYPVPLIPLQSSTSQFSEHPHNRHLQLRRATSAGDIESINPISSSQNNLQPAKSLVSFKQVAVNSYTHKLKMTIAKMQPDDFGYHYCISTNSMGSSEAWVIVARADKLAERKGALLQQKQQQTDQINGNNNDYRSSVIGEKDYQRDSLDFRQPYVQVSSGMTSSSAHQNSLGKNVVYDTNYLQAIKTRLNGTGSSRLPQKHKLRQRNSGTYLQPGNFLAASCLLLSLAGSLGSRGFMQME